MLNAFYSSGLLKELLKVKEELRGLDLIHYSLKCIDELRGIQNLEIILKKAELSIISFTLMRSTDLCQ